MTENRHDALGLSDENYWKCMKLCFWPAELMNGCGY